MRTYSVLDVFGEAVSENTGPIARAPDEMTTPSARARLTSSLNSPTEEVELFSGLYPQTQVAKS